MKKNLLILAALVLLYSGYGAGTAAVAPGKPAVTVKDTESGRNAAEKAVKESVNSKNSFIFATLKVETITT